MPLKLRIEYPGAINHVINRGDQREDIFKDDADRERFVATLGEAFTTTVRSCSEFFGKKWLTMRYDF
jgi:putative transposase